MLSSMSWQSEEHARDIVPSKTAPLSREPFEAGSMLSATAHRKRNELSHPVTSGSFYKDFKLFSELLSICGIDIFEDRSNSIVKLAKYFLFLMMSSLYYLGLLAMVVYVAGTEGLQPQALRFSFTVVYTVLNYIQITWIYGCLFRKQSIIRDLFDKLSVIGDDIVPANSKVHRRIRRWSWASVVIFFTILLGSLVYTWYSYCISSYALSTKPWQDFGVQHSLACGPNDTVLCLDNFHLALVYTVGYVFTVPMYFSFVMLCLLLSYTIMVNYDGLYQNYRLEASDTSVNFLRVIDIIYRHHSLTKIIRVYDEVFQQPLTIFCIEEFINIVFVAKLLNLNKESSMENPYDCVVLVLALFLFTTKLAFVGTMNKKVVSTLEGLTLISEVNKGQQSLKTSFDSELKPRWKYSVISQIELYIRHVTISPPAVSGMGLFGLYSGVLLTAGGLALTYILALYGIPEETDKEIQ